MAGGKFPAEKYMQAQKKIEEEVVEDKLQVSLSRLQAFYGDLDGNALLRVMIREEFPGRVALFSSFGADSALLISMVAEVDKNIPVLFLETGKHFQETLDYVEELKKYFGLTDVRFIRPDPALVLNVDPTGELWKTGVNRCCWLRKVEPLARSLKEWGFTAVITGRKRYQTEDRQNLQAIELDEDNRFRINPFANMSKEEFKAELKAQNLPQHPLVAKGYLSIGCAPCTVAVKPGEDERAGRWAHAIDMQGKQKTECGIHVPQQDWEV